MTDQISALLTAADAGSAEANAALFAALYAELHRIARRELGRPGGPSALGATTLLHEAYLDIAGREGPSFPDRACFMAYAARVMRSVIIDHARRRRAVKRGRGFEITDLSTDVVDGVADESSLADVSDALDALAQTDPSLAELVDLKFFCGFSFAEIAAMRHTSERTVQRHWEKARIFLYRTIKSDPLR